MSTDSSQLNVYGRLAAWVLKNRQLTVILTVALLIVSALMSSQLTVDSNLLALLPESDPDSANLKDLYEKEKGANVVTIAFTAEDPAKLDPYLDQLCADFEALDGVRFAIHEIDPELAFKLGLLQLSPKEINELTVRLQGALNLGPAPNPIILQHLMDMGPLTEKIANSGKGGMFSQEKEGKGRVILRPEGSPTDQEFAEKLMADLYATLDASKGEEHGVKLAWVGGAYRHTVEDRGGTLEDIRKTSLASSALVLTAIALMFRRIRATVLLYIPILAGNVLNLAVVWVLFGSINTYTSMGTAIVIGLGIDYGVHMLGRYREERHLGKEVEDAVILALDRTAPPCMTATVTSMAGFFALAAAQFRGFSQLGIVLAIGLAATLFFNLILLPVLIPLLDRDPPASITGVANRAPSKATYRFSPVLLGVAVLLTGYAATRIPLIEWEFDYSALRRDKLAYSELSDEQKALARESYSPVLIEYSSAEALRKDAARLRHLQEEGKLPHVARIVSVEDLIPADQEAKLAALSRLAALLEHPNLMFLPPPLVKNLERLRGFKAEPVTREALPESILTIVGAARPDTNRIVVFAEGNMWDLREAAKLADELKAAVGPDVKVVGEYMALAAMYRTVLHDMPIVSVIALVMVAALTMLDVRRFHWFAGVFGTFLAGLFWAGFAVQKMGIKISMVNIVGLPILMGLGVDICAHLLHRLQEEGPGGVRRVMRTTGLNASVSTLTNVLAFATLMLAGNRGVRGLGFLVAVGLLSSFTASALLMPLAWTAGWRISGRAPGDTRKKRIHTDPGE